MNIRKYNFKISYQELMYFCAMSFFVITNFIGTTTLLDFDTSFKQTIIYVLKFAMIVLLLIKFIYYDKYSIKIIGKLILIFSFVLISYYFTKGDDLVWLYFFVITSKNIKFDKIVKFLTIFYFFMINFIIMFAISGIISNLSIVTENPVTKQIVTRRLLGFKHVNFLGGNILITYLGYLYLRFKEFNIKDIIVSLLISIVLFVYISSKTSCILIIVSCLFVFFCKYLINKNYIILFKKIIYVIMSLCVIISVCLSIIYNKYYEYLYKLDYMLSHRIEWGNYFYENYGFSILGQEIPLISTIEAQKTGKKCSILDNAYMHLGVRYGLASTIIVIGNYFFVVKKAFKFKKYNLALIIMITFICGITEKWIFMIQYNYFLISTLAVIYEEKGRGKNEENIKSILSEC